AQLRQKKHSENVTQRHSAGIKRAETHQKAQPAWPLAGKNSSAAQDVYGYFGHENQHDQLDGEKDGIERVPSTTMPSTGASARKKKRRALAPRREGRTAESRQRVGDRAARTLLQLFRSFFDDQQSFRWIFRHCG